MKTNDFYFELPESLIAQVPLEDRTKSRLMVVNREKGDIVHSRFESVLEFLSQGDCLVLNNTKVIPARLYGTMEDGTIIEILLIKRLSLLKWEALMKPGKKVKAGKKLNFGNGELQCIVEEEGDNGIKSICFLYQGIFEEILDKLGNIPLPPYIKEKLNDPSRYNTVYAKHEGSVAAPTAGLHFSKDLLDKAMEKGINIAYITLHIGLGTFRPVRVESVETHIMHSEFYMIDSENAEIINRTKKNGGRVVAVGTTSVRTLETIACELGSIKEQNGWTDIFIYPGYKFKIVDGIITNFHLPESTLIMLVSAFSDKDKILNAYNIAVQEKYRFFSFGDAMMLI